MQIEGLEALGAPYEGGFGKYMFFLLQTILLRWKSVQLQK